MIFVELGDGGFKREVTPCDLEPLHEIGGAGEQDTPSVLDESKAEGGAEMRFATAGRAEDQKIGALFQPAIAGAERHDLGLGDHGNGVEVEAVEGFSGWQPRLFQM